jgi:GMP synthase-like glutamine amidotransferase
VVNNGTHFLAEMLAALNAIGVEYELVSGSSTVLPSMLDAFSGIILTGGDVHVFEPGHLAMVSLDTQVLDRAAVPVLGICLGHQLIAHHFGATIQPLPQPVDRDEFIEIVSPNALFARLPRRFRVRMARDDAVVGIGGPLVRLARSTIGDYEAIRHRDRPIYGLQFHPEASGAAGLTVIENFIGLCRNEATIGDRSRCRDRASAPALR